MYCPTILQYLIPLALQANRDVYVVDLDKPFHDLIKAAYKGTMPRVAPRVTSRTGIFRAQFPASQDGEQFGEQFGVQSSFPGRLPSIAREDSDGVIAGETNEEGVEGFEGVMRTTLSEDEMNEEVVEGSGVVKRPTLAEASGRADAALQPPDEDPFSAFEDFVRSDGGGGCESRTLSWAMAQPLIGSEPCSFWHGRRVVGRESLLLGGCAAPAQLAHRAF